MIEVAALELDGAAGDIEHPCRNAVRAQAVDDGPVALLPEEVAEPLGGADEQEVIQLVEVPLVEQELIQPLMIPREFFGQIRLGDVEHERHQRAQHHHHRRRILGPGRNLFHVLDDGGIHLQRLAEELLDAVTGEQLLERKAGKDRARRQHEQRNQHHQRALVRRLIVMLVVRLAEEGLEHQAP